MAMSKVAAEASTLNRLTRLKSKVTTRRLLHAFEREALLVFFVGISVFYWTALTSFSPLDSSWLTAVYPKTPPANLAGTAGANISSGAIYIWGLVAWGLPLPFLSIALGTFRKVEHNLSAMRLLGWGVLHLAAAATAAWIRPTFQVSGIDLPSGGVVGATLRREINSVFGQTGGMILLATTALIGLLWVLRRPLIEPLTGSMKRLWTKIPTPKPVALFTKKSKRTESSPKTSVDLRDSIGVDEPFQTEQDTGVQFAARPQSKAQSPQVDEEAGPVDGPAFDLPGFNPPSMTASPSTTVSPGNDAEAASISDVPPIALNSVQKGAPQANIASAPAYIPPPLTVFNRADGYQHQLSPHELETTSALLVKTFEDFGVQGKVIGYQPGPVVTVYEFQPDAGIKQSKILGLIDDLALALKADSIFIHPVRGKRALGVQVPNSKREPVHLGDILGTPTFKEATSPLTFGLGKTITGQPMCADLTAMPHLLVAGATGSGKSVGINAMLCSIIMKATPEQVRMILVDPKMLELSVYEGIPHLLMPVITEPSKASLALKWAASEMERRYRLMQLACVRNIEGFNDFWSKASADRKTQLREALDDSSLDRLPYILLVIDELADLMMTAPKDVEAQIQRLAQKARASGIHMVLATQRPSVDIITGVIKANLPSRIAYQVVSKHDSRTILDLIGAEKLLGKGDLLFQKPGTGRLERLQGALITDEEVLNLVASVKASSEVQYDERIISWIDDEFARQKDGGEGSEEASNSPDDEPKFNEAVAIARAHGVVSASFLQRHLKIGYNRAARIVEFMESKGLVDKADGAKPRRWLGA